MTRITTVALLVLCCLGVPALAADLQPGGIFFSGTLTDRGFYRMEVQTRQASAGDPQIRVIKVYSEPSHTLLLAFLDDASPMTYLPSVLGEGPQAMASAALEEARLLVETTAPPPDDQRIRVEYATDSGAETGFQVLVDILFESLDEVGFSAEPLGGGNHHLCGWCGPGGQMQFCGCVDCSTPECTICCNVNPCTIYCGYVLCSH